MSEDESGTAMNDEKKRSSQPSPGKRSEDMLRPQRTPRPRKEPTTTGKRKPEADSERKKVEKTLRESEERYRALFDRSPDCIYIHDFEGRFLDANKAALELLGYERQEIRSLNFASLLSEDQLPLALQTIQEIRETGFQKGLTEYRLQHKNGNFVEVETQGSAILSKGKYTAIQSVARDITERKRMEEALRDSERRLIEAQRIGKFGNWEWNPAENRVIWSAEMYDIFGIPPETVLTTEMTIQAFHPEDRAIVVETTRKTLDELKPQLIECRILKPDGTIGYVQGRGEIVVDANGKLVKMIGIYQDITERKRMEEALRESEESFHSLFKNSTIGLYRTTPDGRILLANPELCQMLGFPTFEELARRNLDQEDLSTDHSRQAFRQEIEEKGEIRGLESAWKRRDGTILFVRESAHTVRDAEGRVLYYEGTVEDITERKQVEQELQLQRDFAMQVVNAMGQGLTVTNAEGRFEFVNPAYARLFGYTPADLIGKQPQDVTVPEDHEILEQQKAERQAGKTSTYETRLRRADGSLAHILITAVPRKREGGYSGTIAVITDITERKRMEEALRDSEEWNKFILQTILSGLIVIDTVTRKIVEANNAALKLIGLSKEQVIGTVCHHFICPAEEKNCPILDLGKEVDFSERILLTADGKRKNIIKTVVPVQLHGRGYLIESFVDITERKQLEERIRQVRNDLLFAVSHDMKTPLQALNQSQEMLNEPVPGEGLARFREYGEIWRRNLQRLERMINNLVDSQRGEEDRFPLLLAPCDPVEMVQQVVEDLTGYALTQQVTFDLQLKPLPEGACDSEAFARVVENLLINAVKFSPKGGRVEIRFGMEGDTLLLEVEDHGAGISPEEQAQLFQPFQRGRSAQQKGIPGTGLGLYVCRRIMEAHGGTIALASEEGKGTKVVVRLPWKKGTE